MAVLVVEEDVRLEGGQHAVLGYATEEEGLVDAHLPGTQGADHPFVGGAVARGDQRGADRRRAVDHRIELELQVGQGFQQLGKGAFRQRVLRVFLLVFDEGLQSLFLVDAFRLLGEQHRIAVEGDANLLQRLAEVVRRAFVDQAGGHLGFHRRLDIFLGGRQEQIHIEGIEVLGHRLTAGEGGAGDVETVMVDGIGDAQAGVGRIARNDHHLDMAFALLDFVDLQHRLDQRKADAGL